MKYIKQFFVWLTDYLKARFKEPSTYMALVMLGSAFGLYTQDQGDAILQLVLALVGVQGFVTKA